MINRLPHSFGRGFLILAQDSLKRRLENWSFFAQNKPLLLAFIWSFVFILLTSIWIILDNKPPAWDEAHYLTGSEYLYQTLNKQGFFAFLTQTTNILGTKAPLISLSPIPLFIIFGSSVKISLIVNIFYFILFGIFFYLLVSKLYSRNIAFLSLLITSTMPLFYGLSRNFLVEFGLTAICFLWLYLLYKSKYLTNTGYVILLGITFGFGFLMKFPFFIFTGLPFAWASYKLIKSDFPLSKKLNQISLVLIPILLIAGPWYSKNILTVLWHAKRAANPELLGSIYYGSPASIAVAGRYALEIINDAISGYYFLIAIVLLIVLFIRRIKVKFNLFLLSYFFPPFIIFFFGPNKDYRLMLPVLPIFAIFIAQMYFEIFKLKRLFYFVLFLFPVIIFTNNSLGTNIFSKKISVGPFLIADNRIGNYAEVPYKYKLSWSGSDLLKFIESISGGGKKTIVLASEDEYLNINSLAYSNTLSSLPFKIKTVSYFPINYDKDEVLNLVESGDFLVMKTGGNMGPIDINRTNEFVLNWADSSGWIKIPNGFEFLDGGIINIYKNDKK